MNAEANYKSLVETASDAIISLDHENRVILWNSSAEKIFGYTKAEATGSPVFGMFIPEEHANTLKELIETSQGAGSQKTVEIAGRHKNGGLFPIELSAYGRKLPNGWTSTCILRDITRRKRMEQTMQEARSEAQRYGAEMAALMDAVPAAVFIAHDVECLRVSGNRTTHELLGLPSTVDLSRSAPPVERPASFLTMKDGPQIPVEQLPVRMAASGREVRDYELDLVFSDGRLRTIFGNAVPMLDECGQPRGAIAAFIDITARKQAEEELRRNREWLGTTLNSIGDAVIAADSSGLVTFLNPIARDLTGWQLEEACGLPILSIFRIIDEKTRQPAEDIVERVLREGCVVSLANNTVLVARDGREIPIEDSAAPIRNPSGETTGVVLVFHDVTEKRRAQEALKQSEELYRSLFDNMLNGYAYCRMLFEKDEPKDFVYLNVNSAFGALTGLENVIGKKVSEVVPGIRESDAELFEIYGRVAKTGIPERFETYVEALGMWFSISVYSPRKEHFVAVFDVITERKQAEEELLRANNEWERTFDSVPDLIAILDTRHRIVRANLAMAQRLGVTPEQCAGLRCCESVHGSLEPPEFCPHTLTLSDGKEHVAELHEERLGGDFVVSTTPLRDEHGVLFGTVHVARDITERKRMEEDLRENRSRLDLALRSAHMGVWHLDLIQDKRHFDDQVCHLLGIDPAKFCGTAEEFFGVVHPDDREMINAALVRTIEQDVPYETEYRVVWPDGSVHYISTRGMLVDDDNGRPVRVNGLTWDITGRKETEENSARLAAIVESTDDAIIGKTADGEIISWNRAAERIYGYTAEEIVGRSISVLAPNDYPDEVPAILRRIGCGEDVKRCDTIRRRKDGRDIDVSLTISAIKDASGKISGASTIVRDITERKRMEDELRKSRNELELRVRERTAELRTTIARLDLLNQELQEFAFIASHDLQEPLRKIQTFGNLLIKNHTGVFDPQGQDYLKRMVKAAIRMSELLRALLDYSRTGSTKLNYESVCLTEVAQDAISNLELLIAKLDGTVGIGELPIVDADPTLLRQLFQNIIGNSIKYRKESEPPVVRIYGNIEDATCRITIEDNGIGFDQNYCQKIFKPFERLHGKNSPYSGTGMGLAICRKIVDRHGGQITATGIPGQGATFIVTLPAKQQTRV